MRIALIIVAVLVVIVLLGLFAVTRGMKEIKNLSIENPDVSQIQDGEVHLTAGMQGSFFSLDAVERYPAALLLH